MKPVILVTGASRGLGRATAQALDSVSTRLALTARSPEPLRELESELTEAIALPADLADPKTPQKLIEQVLERFGRLDAVVNNAGLLGPVAPLAKADLREWETNLKVNLLAPVALIQAALPALRESRGRIVNVSTGAALKPMVGWSAYCSSKAGFLHLTTVLAQEEPLVTSVSLRPGVIDTAMQAQIREQGRTGMAQEAHQKFLNLYDQGQLEPPEVPGRTAAWLALKAPLDWSGQFLQYSEPRLAEPAASFFGRESRA